MRFQQMDKATKERQSNWLDFQKGASKKKAGVKKQSIFAVPADPGGKVGVVRSGMGMTPNPERKRTV